MTNLTRIVAAVVDTKQATLYKADGTTVAILQGDARLRPILEHITPLLSSQGWAEIDLTETNQWTEFAEKSNGAVRLFKIAKSKLASFFGAKKEEASAPYLPGVVGEVPKGITSAAKNMAAVDEILQHAQPVTAKDFDESKVAQQRPTVEANGHTPNDARRNEGSDAHYDKAEDTIIAVTAKGKVVPGVERIKSQFVNAGKTGNMKGLQLFLDRIAAVQDKRKHTVDDLLRFMERGDLPIADDGTIVIYKKLYRRAGGVFVDPYTSKVTQKVGSYVHMDISMVDHNRRNECSNGLHVARRGYVGSFSGDAIVLAKVRPEDVIAVPDYDANKMRVCGYHIIEELTQQQYQAINTNRPLSQAEGGEELLGRAISGDHIGIIQNVKITDSKGGGLIITDLVAEKVAEPKPAEAPVAVESTEEASEVDDITDEAPQAPPPPPPPVAKAVKKRVSKKVKKANRKVAAKKAVARKAATAKSLEAHQPGVKTDAPVVVGDLQKLKDGKKADLAVEVKGPVTQTETVKAMWDAALAGSNTDAQRLLDFKKAAKKGWTVWGLPANAGDQLKALLKV